MFTVNLLPHAGHISLFHMPCRFALALKLAQALYLGTPILLLDDIFDKLDSTRVERIVSLLQSDRFGQIFITDTDRQHLTDILRPSAEHSKIFVVENGRIGA